MSGRHNIDDIFKNNLKHHEVIPPLSVWGSLHHDLPVPVPFYKKPVVWASSFLLLLLFGVGGYFFINVTNKADAIDPKQENIETDNISKTSNIPASLFATLSNNEVDITEFCPPPVTDKPSLASQYLATKNTATTSLAVPLLSKKTISAFASTTQEPSKMFVLAQAVDNKNLLSSKLRQLQTSFATSKNTPVFANQLPQASITSNFLKGSPTVAKHPQETTAKMANPSKLAVNQQNALNPLGLSLESITLDFLDSREGLVMVDSEVLTEVSDFRPKPVIDLPVPKTKLDTEGFHIGVATSLNNTWVLNKKAKEEFKGRLGLDWDFGYDYGLSLGYNFTTSFGVQLEWIINSRQGQQYERTSRGFSNSRSLQQAPEINLRYTQFPILVKYRMQRMSRLTHQPFVISYLAGFQYGWLKSAEVNIDSPILQQDLLRKTSWGFVGGIDYELFLTKNIYTSLGIRSSLSTSSNSVNQISLPSRKTTNNFLLGVQAGIHYRIKHK